MKKIICLMSAFLLMFGIFAGCGGETGVPLSYDDQINEDGSFNENLFYRNDLETAVADPAVIYIDDENSTEYGYYYMFGTSDASSFRAWRSKTLEHWEDMSEVVGYPAFYAPDNCFAQSTFWAPEVIYDADLDKYFMFFSGQNRNTTEWGVMLGVAEADEPYGPYVMTTRDGHDATTPLFDADKMYKAIEESGMGDPTEIFTCIDPHPYVAPDGQKYLYFVRDRAGSEQKTHIWGMKMNTWTDPDYSSVTRLTRTGYYTVDDQSEENIATYEGTNNYINEGPYIYESLQSDGSYRYYLTLSINGYTDKTYSVIQAVGNSPLGPFTKLKEEDGGILIGTDGQSWDHISGPGHHSFIRIGDELYVLYHEHIDRLNGNSQRYAAIDRVEITHNAKGEEVLYVNGPTWSLQPRVEEYAEYKNIAGDADVSAPGENVDALTDKLLSLYSYIDYVKEYTADRTTTITLTFDDYREVTGIMIYNSKYFDRAFVDIARIEVDCRTEDGAYEGMAYIDDLAFDWDFYRNEYADAMRPGGSAVAIFDPLLVKEIRITVELPETRPDNIQLTDEEGWPIKQTQVAVSEIVVLGK